MSWRVLFALGGVLIFIGGPMHPGGTMAEMLAHEDWFMSHALMTVAFAAMTAGLVIFAREAAAPRLARWTRFAIAGTAIQALEMAVHTAAYVDHANLVAGAPTPVLTTHLWMSILLSPLFGLAVAGFIIVAARERAIGSLWIAWLGVLGVLAYGVAATLIAILGAEWPRILFPAIIGLSIWLVLAAIWPSSALRASPSAPRPSGDEPEGKPRVAPQA